MNAQNYMGRHRFPNHHGIKVRHFACEAMAGTLVSMTAALRWLSTKEASARLGITLRTLYRLIDEGQVPAYKFGRVIRLKESEIDAFIESARVVPGKLNHLYPESRVEKVGAEEED